jgi:hypothetical protein
MSTVRNTLEETLKSTVNGIVSNHAHQLSDWLRENKDVDVSPEELCTAFDIPYRPVSTPMSGSSVQTVLPNMPSYYSGTVSPAKKKGGRTKKTVDPNAAKCEYKMTRGKTPGKSCDAPVANDGSNGSDRFCKACLKKAAVKALIEGSSTKSTVQPPQMSGNSISIDSVPEEKSQELQVVPIPGQDDWFKETVHGFIVHQDSNGAITAHKIEDKKGGQRDLDENEKKIATNLGLQVINKEAISIPTLPVLSNSNVPMIPTIPNIPMAMPR